MKEFAMSKWDRGFDKIVCVGKNYIEHAKELGDAIPEMPVLFMKPSSVLRSALKTGDRVSLRIPPDAGELHHECEIVLRLKTGGYRLSLPEAASAIGSVTLGLDMTLRERQAALKKQGHPWEVSKAFLDSAAVGPWMDVGDFSDWLDRPFRFLLDGKLRQSASAGSMTLTPAQCVAYISEHFSLLPGDLIFTGTPAGVGPVTAGQVGELEWGPIHYFVEWEAFGSN
jgi:2-keto-4-pentenoate hydratase/2-oxohepta-3-ene-1,7-dioic acid hydratase in catechol pathway